MFTLLFLLFCLLRTFNKRLEYRHKIAVVHVLFLLTLIFTRLQNKKRSDSFIRQHYVLKTRQEIAAANEPTVGLNK
jgi:hypothetical protein